MFKAGSLGRQDGVGVGKDTSGVGSAPVHGHRKVKGHSVLAGAEAQGGAGEVDGVGRGAGRWGACAA